MSTGDIICIHGIYLANCGACQSRLELGLSLVRDESQDPPLVVPWPFDEKVQNLVKAAEALIACSEMIYAGTYRVPSDCIEKLKEETKKVKES